ncbi:hypothetical protein ROU73_004473 [Escherichia coli]|uniref:hypothetical protein n=1 Tax=Escherichia sp. 20412-1 TaxID=2137853 RepID=UPI000D1693BB|nr:hypothetical protein [Escherichia sp. 20412-1]EFA5700946.1 hypothetical protein [Escherichia coli]EHM4464154.1 hypothetical protein [Escherichia coli]EHM4561341.1 hypothetical protein [Escherichia coli]EHU4694756.1 hypothetical protein [Escherichia coli]EIC3241214.1 hypothetical protein [Escherichia coli]
MDKEDENKYSRIFVEVNMKDGLKIESPATKETGMAVNLVLKALAATIVMYGIAKVIIAVGTVLK